MDINISEAKAQLSKLVIAYHGEKVVKGSLCGNGSRTVPTFTRM
jgi:hypothetical protein